jgi:two-component system sensor histidine kinase/response regulator
MTQSPPLLVGSQPSEALHQGSTFPPTILLVDDNSQKRIALKAALTSLGYPIVEAASGVAALRCISTHNFAVILLDVCMPDMDGFETAALIRQRRQSEMTPIIFITAYRDDEIIKEDHYAQGAVDFIFAPIEPDELRAKVSVFANMFEKSATLERHAAEQRASADQWRLLSDAAPVGIFETDGEGRYVYINPRWSQITGISSVQALGNSWDTVLTLGPHGRTVERIAGREGDAGERFQIQDPGLNSRSLIVTSVPLLDSNGIPAGFVGTVADVSAEAEAEAAMSKAKDSAEGASKMKSDFLANMSHEIRTPMNGVLGLTELLLDTELDAAQLDYVRSVQSCGEALLKIINDILDFSKVESGMLELRNTQFPLRPLINGVLDLLSPSAQAKSLELLENIDASVPMVFSGDSGRLRQILTNLVGNAIKFTQFGEVAVRVMPVEVSGEEAVIRFEVSDTGDGIAPDKLGDIFQPFVQADTSSSRKYEGTGLGLAITARLVALMGGDCGVTSRLGFGSVFWFTVRVGAHQKVTPPAEAIPEAGSNNIRALVVVQNPSERQALSDMLEHAGISVDIATSSRIALAMLRKKTPQDRQFSIAFIDRFMTGMDGLALAEAVISDSRISTRLVLLAGKREGPNLRRAIADGLCNVLLKPIDFQALIACIGESLGLPSSEVESHATCFAPGRRSEKVSLGRILLAEDNLVNQKVAVAMLSGAGYEVDVVSDGHSAVDALFSSFYDAVLMDCQMPGLNGYQATESIRARETGGRRIPIIALTAGAMHEDQERCILAGMDSYLSKPVTKEELLDSVGSAINFATISHLAELGPTPVGAA